MFSLIAQDKANHEVYGARIASVCASVVYVIVAAALKQPAYARPAAALAAVGSAAAAGKIKEELDRRANRKALARGETPPHSVESADIVATTKGGVVVALPIAVSWFADGGAL